MSGDPYIKENEELQAEIGKLQYERGQMWERIKELRAALEEISNYGYDVENDDAYPLKEIARKALAKEGKCSGT